MTQRELENLPPIPTKKFKSGNAKKVDFAHISITGIATALWMFLILLKPWYDAQTLFFADKYYPTTTQILAASVWLLAMRLYLYSWYGRILIINGKDNSRTIHAVSIAIMVVEEILIYYLIESRAVRLHNVPGETGNTLAFYSLFSIVTILFAIIVCIAKTTLLQKTKTGARIHDYTLYVVVGIVLVYILTNPAELRFILAVLIFGVILHFISNHFTFIWIF